MELLVSAQGKPEIRMLDEAGKGVKVGAAAPIYASIEDQQCLPDFGHSISWSST